MTAKKSSASFTFLDDDTPIEQQLVRAGCVHICGVDEAGRGPLAGPVVAAAVLHKNCDALLCACDSKIIAAVEREERFVKLTNELAYGVGAASAEEIDTLNILQASLIAMRRAVDQLAGHSISIVLVDGNYRLPGEIPSRAIVDGDARVAVIGAASIIAKVTRDRIMAEFDSMYPRYRFAEHKGYPTPDHRRILQKIGPCPIHRKTFRGVSEFFQRDA